MRALILLVGVVLITPAPSTQQPGPLPMKRITPIIVVDSIEPCTGFWTEQLGFSTTATVPHGDVLGFAMMERGGVQVMYQSRASVEADLGESGGPAGLAEELASSTTTLFVEVEDLDQTLSALGEVEVIVPRRQTFYGMDEIFVRAPCGTLLGLAASIAEEE